jgi:hypothetical protein
MLKSKKSKVKSQKPNFKFLPFTFYFFRKQSTQGDPKYFANVIIILIFSPLKGRRLI